MTLRWPDKMTGANAGATSVGDSDALGPPASLSSIVRRT
jgi:hypothetical protein